MVELVFREGRCQNKEDSHFEAKSGAKGIPGSLWETYSAFANTSGGTIVLGLDESDDREGFIVSGLKNAEGVRDDLWNTLNNPEKVSVNILMDRDLRVVEVFGRSLIVMDVPEAERTVRPVYIRNVGSGTYKRNGSGDYHCTPAEIGAMYRDASPVAKDGEAAREATLDDLLDDQVEMFRNMMSSIRPENDWVAQPREEFLRLIGAARMSDGILRPTLAGLIMFGRESETVLEVPGFSLDYREYGDDGGEWTLRRLSGTPGWSGCLFEFYVFVSNRISVTVPTGFQVPDGMTRRDDTDLVRILREALTNGVMHADYWGTGGVVVELRPDRLEVRNPGTFRIPVERAEQGGESDPRNPLLFRMLNLIGRAERAGSGVRSMMTVSEGLGLERPEIEECQRPDAVRVSIGFGRPTVYDRLERGIVEAIEENPKVTVVEIAKGLGVSRNRVLTAMDMMKASGRLERVGGSRGHWVLR